METVHDVETAHNMQEVGERHVPLMWASCVGVGMLYQHMHDEGKRHVAFIQRHVAFIIREWRSAACTNPQHYAVCVLRLLLNSV